MSSFRSAILYSFAAGVLATDGCEQKKLNGFHSPLVTTCSFTSVVPLIDGRLNEDEWTDTDALLIEDKGFQSIENNLPLSDNIMLIRTLWDRENLYLAFHVEDRNLVAKQTSLDHSQLFMDDMIEFLIDAANDKSPCWTVDDIVYHINLLGQKKDDRGTKDCHSDSAWNGQARYAVQLLGTLNDVRDTDSGYNVEVAIPWEELGISPSRGTRIGINFANGNDGILFDWAGANSFRSPDAFGDLILHDELSGG